jgi:hypothetical protein
VNQNSQRSPWVTTIVVIVIVMALCGGVVFTVRSMKLAQYKKLSAECDKLKTSYEAMDQLIKQQGDIEAKLAEHAKLLKPYQLPAKADTAIPAKLVELGIQTVSPDDAEARLVQDLATLSDKSGCEILEYKPSAYKMRKVDADPRREGKARTDDAELKKAQEVFAGLPQDKQRKIERDNIYSDAQKALSQFADEGIVDIKIRGRMADIQRFICGLSRWPTQDNYRFPHLVMVANLSIHAVTDSSKKTQVGANPVLEASLSTRVFNLHPLDFTRKSTKPGPPGTGTTPGAAGGASGEQAKPGATRQPSRT